MANAEQLERAIRDLDTHHARVIKEVEDRLSARIDALQAQVAELAARLQSVERKK